MTMAVIGFGYALYQSTQVKLIPYIVEVDKLGTSVNAGFPQQIEYADPRVVRATLGSFVSNFRSVTPDAVVQKQYIDRTYGLLRTSDPATEKVNAWFRSNSPFEKAKSATVAIEVNNIVALSNQSYQIDWTEFERDRRGKETATRRFRGIATVTLTPPQDEGSSVLIPSVSISETSTGPRSFERHGSQHEHTTLQNASRPDCERAAILMIFQPWLSPLSGTSRRWRHRQRGEGNGHFDTVAWRPRARDERRGRKGHLPLWRGTAIRRLLTASGLRHRASGWRGRSRRAGRRYRALESRARNLGCRGRAGDPSDRQAVGAGSGHVDGRDDVAADLSYQLKSHATQYMARVGFFEYPEDVSPKLADVNARLEASTIPGAGRSAEQLSFAYSVSGSAGWRPTRVYSDGQKTYIQFPRSISGQDAPVLFVVSGGQNRIVNYRMKSNMMVVDYNIDRAVLVSGVGWKQQKVTISRGGR